MLYPQQCRICSSPVERYDDGIACQMCWLDPTVTKIIRDPVCSKCGMPLEDGAGSRASTASESTARASGARASTLCGVCDSFPFSAARACGVYGGAFEASILFLKSQPHICRRLQQIIIASYSINSAALAADLIIPVPLHRWRGRERGFNQSKIIASLIARNHAIKLDNAALVRIKPTERHRAGLDAADRARSVKGAFKALRPEAIKNLSVLLVDDLFTTGSTLSAAAESLLNEGAARVSVFTIARVARSERRS
jgi:ComF family protein